jgi:hypothetical protein
MSAAYIGAVTRCLPDATLVFIMDPENWTAD